MTHRVRAFADVIAPYWEYSYEAPAKLAFLFRILSSDWKQRI